MINKIIEYCQAQLVIIIKYTNKQRYNAGAMEK